MKCSQCDGEGVVDHPFTIRCGCCDGSGQLCDICGEAAEVGADTCEDCLDEAEPVANAIKRIGGAA